MAKKLAYERYCWFHNQVKAGLFPNAKRLAEHFEISHKQAQRDIEFIRDRLGAPLSYNKYRGGYYYEDNTYQLPPIFLNSEELYALILSARLASTIPNKHIKTSIYQVLDKIVANNSSKKINVQQLLKKISVKNIEYYKTDGNIFQTVLYSLYKDKTIRIDYYSPHKKEKTKRVIKPLHLLCYMGRWYLIAFCDIRKELRDFTISRIKGVEEVDINIELPADLPDIKEYIDRTFGLLTGDRHIEVCLEFSPDISDWIAEQVWHESQVVTKNGDGSICLKFPVSDFREIKGEILKFGASVRVLAPEELKEEIKREIEKMKKNYL